MKFDNLMVDIETSGLIAGEHGILQIGAVAFNFRNDSWHPLFTNNVKLHPDRKWLESTKKWWVEDKDRKKLLAGIESTNNLPCDVMQNFNEFCHENLNEKAKFWSNHTIDWEMINDYVRLTGLTNFFFKYNAFRDMRSFIHALEVLNPDFNYTKIEPKIAHNAVCDAKAQVYTLQHNLKIFEAS